MTVVCGHVEKGTEVLLSSHEFDGDLVISCGDEGQGMEDWHLAGLLRMTELHPALTKLPEVGPGREATRGVGQTNWIVTDISNDN
ncbi:MAG: hypothetical protein BVN33_01565 [Proteobacteria bacterium ST_bin13]|nr:MAG: hypothetical protein BVN33_01565 [Proteobacteria bacterium ST_bin13]